MTDTAQSKRQILKATSIIGCATIGVMAIGMVRMKLIALLVGPAGVGLFGLFNTLLAMGVSIVGMGLDTSGVRQLSASGEDREAQRVARWSLWVFAWPLAIAGGLAFWLLREPLARIVIGDAAYSGWVGWLAIAVPVSIIATAQLAVVQSLRRLRDLAGIRLWGALLATLASVAAIYSLGLPGVVVASIATPIALSLAALAYSRRLSSFRFGKFPGRRRLHPDVRLLVTLGALVMITSTIGSITQAAVRAILAQRLGLEAAGFFQASFAISSLNLTLLLGAMVPEYYPRLSAIADDPKAMSKLANEQVEVALLLAAPTLIAISVAAPFLLSILYSSEFIEATLLLRFQVAADALRIAGWALGYVLLARKFAVAYLLVEIAFGLVFVPITWVAATEFGVAAAGGAYLIGYIVSLAAAIAFCAKAGVTLRANIVVRLVGLASILVAIAALSLWNGLAAMIGGTAAFLIVAAISLRAIRRIGLPLPPFAAFLTRGRETPGSET